MNSSDREKDEDSVDYDKIFNKRKKTDKEKFEEQVVMKNEYYDLED